MITFDEKQGVDAEYYAGNITKMNVKFVARGVEGADQAEKETALENAIIAGGIPPTRRGMVLIHPITFTEINNGEAWNFTGTYVLPTTVSDPTGGGGGAAPTKRGFSTGSGRKSISAAIKPPTVAEGGSEAGETAYNTVVYGEDGNEFFNGVETIELPKKPPSSLINVDKDGNAQGIEVPAGAPAFSLTFAFPTSSITLALEVKWESLAKKVIIGAFNGRPADSVLFDGVSYETSEGDTVTYVTFNFESRKPLEDFAVVQKPLITVTGSAWDYYEVYYTPVVQTVDGKEFNTQVACGVERKCVIERIDGDELGIGS